jgi:hypothetical protein
MTAHMLVIKPLDMAEFCSDLHKRRRNDPASEPRGQQARHLDELEGARKHPSGRLLDRTEKLARVQGL